MAATQLCSYALWRHVSAGRPAMACETLVDETAALIAHLGALRRLEVRMDAIGRSPAGHKTNPVRYAVNELASVCGALAVPLENRAARPAGVVSR